MQRESTTEEKCNCYLLSEMLQTASMTSCFKHAEIYADIRKGKEQDIACVFV